MNTLMEIIKARKSVRAYKDTPLSQEIVDTIIEAGQHAPTARNLQQLEYKVITNTDLIRKLSDGIARAMQNAPNMPPPPPNAPKRLRISLAPLSLRRSNVSERLNTPGELDEAMGWPFGRAERLARADRIPHYRLPDGSIRFRIEEVLALTRHVPPLPRCSKCGVVLETPNGSTCVACCEERRR